MAKLSAHGKVLLTVERGGFLRRVMSDGVILKSFRYGDGTLGGWTIITRQFKGRADAALAAARDWEARHAA